MKPRFFYVDDTPLWLNLLEDAFGEAGFSLEKAENAQQAGQWIKDSFDETLDVAILDMELGINEPVTGADIGKKMLEIQKGKKIPVSPEFLIFSKYEAPLYYKQAFAIGAASYLNKEEVSRNSVVYHTLALALRRRLNVYYQNLIGKIEKIVQRSWSQNEALIHFFSEIVTQEVSSCLNTDFILLLTFGFNDNCYAFSNKDYRLDKEVISTLQTYITSKLGVSGSIELRSSELGFYNTALEYQELKIFDHACSMNLVSEIDMKLSLILLDSGKNKYIQDLKAFASTIESYFHASILSVLMTITAKWAACESSKKTILRSNSMSFMYIGQQQIGLIRSAIEQKEVNPEKTTVQKMLSLGENLYDMGQLLSAILFQKEKGEIASYSSLSARKLVDSLWETFPSQKEISLNFEGEDIMIPIKRKNHYLEIVFSCILKWFIDRNRYRDSEDGPIEIWVRFRKHAKSIEILLDDTSPRLPEFLRRSIFEPFSDTTESEINSSLLRTSDFKEPAKFIVKLRDAIQENDFASLLIKKNLSESFQQQIEEYKNGDAISEELLANLVEEFNNMIQKEGRLRLNRLLLEDAYPQEIVKSQEVLWYMPLYLAKMIVEVHNEGILEDRTQDMERMEGHRFAVQFPLSV